MKGRDVSRRDVLAAAGLALAGGAIATGRWGDRSKADSTSGAGRTVILQGGQHVVPAAAMRRFAATDALLVRLEADPVRQWRGAQARLLAARTTRLLGASSWPQFLMVRGLAEESGRRVRYQRFDTASGNITWLIA